jgi:tRNA (guanine37-N1)-methyltransferase
VRIDIVTIFPDYFVPLNLSLIGKARDKGLIDIRIHDLRSWAEDAHKTVDDTPYGGGAGMVMLAEPWGRALDDVLTPTSTLVIPTPSGHLFHQDTAKEWSAVEHLVFACGRYEGIDQRVIDHYSDTHDVRCVSMGDYVLNGGEVAVLAMVEAVGRLIPGVVGNPESLVEESHEDGFLEYPVYTKPATWRGLAVPDVLLSGHHGDIRSWRAEQAKKRTLETRPDLLADGGD